MSTKGGGGSRRGSGGGSGGGESEDGAASIGSARQPPNPTSDDGGGTNTDAGATATIDPTQPTPRRSNVGLDRTGGGEGSGGGGGGRGMRLPSPAKRSPMKSGGGRGARGGSSSSPRRRPTGRNIAEDYEGAGNGGDDDRPELPRLGGAGGSGSSKHHHHKKKDHHHHYHKKKSIHHHKKGRPSGSSSSSKKDDDDEEEEKEDETTISALSSLLSTYRPEDILDDDEVLRMSQKAHTAYKRAMERRRDQLIFGPDDSSSDDSDGPGGGGSPSSNGSGGSGKGLGLLLAEVAEDADPEEAMWKYGRVEERFFDSMVVAAAVGESKRRLASSADDDDDDDKKEEATTAGGGRGASAVDGGTATDEETAHSEDDGGNATDEDNASAAPGSPKPNITKHGGQTPIGITQTSKVTPKKLSAAASSTGDKKAPRVVMHDPTLDELRKSLGLRESEFVFSSTGRRRKHHYIRPRRRHRHHYAHMHHHGHDGGGSTEDDYDGNGDDDDTENVGVSRALGPHTKQKKQHKPTRVTRRLTKAHREKKKEERHARQLRGLEALVDVAMDLEVTINGTTMNTADALTKVDFESSSDEESYDSRGGSARKRRYSTGGDYSSSDESSVRRGGSSKKKMRSAYDMIGSRPGKNEEVPLYAMVPAAEYGRVRRRAGRLMAATSGNQSATVDYDSDDIWDGGTAFRPVTVTRIIVFNKPVYLAKLTKQISDAAKSRRERQRKLEERALMIAQTEAKKDRQRRREEELREGERARASKRQKIERAPVAAPAPAVYHETLHPVDHHAANDAEEGGEERDFDEDGPIIPPVVSDFRIPDVPGKVFNQPISLSLLDWRRRQQWFTSEESHPGQFGHQRRSINLHGVSPDLDCEAELEAFQAAYRDGKKRPTAEIASAGLDSAKETWQTIGLGPDISRQQPATVESPRRRHADTTYASWCAQLIHCLSGSGRNMARHEFFYSDIDRAWFNFDSFGADVANLGIPEAARLTRSEWSLVRRGIRKRPRRFSRRFANSQAVELNKYREKARKIQRGDDAQRDRFGFDVPAPIRIGTTVSALNKRARIVHRGIVLNRHPGSNGYLVQFERKELGYEFCPDIEVASHGIPDIILPPAEVALDGSYMGSFSWPGRGELGSLPYGTTYGPLIDHQKGWEHQNLAQLQKVPENMIVRTFILEALQKPTSDALNSVPKADENEEVTDKDAEREALVKIMGALENMKVRKTVLLDAIELCHKRWQMARDANNGSVDANGVTTDAFKAHYAWLLANLDLTNQAIRTAMAHLRIMYGKAYFGGESSLEADDEKERVNRLEASLKDAASSPQWTQGMWDNWVATAVEGSKNIGGEIVPTILENDHTSENGNFQARLDFLESRLSSAATLLQVIKMCDDGCNDYLSENSSSQAKNKPADASATGKSLQEALRNLSPSFINQRPSLSAEVDLAREQSYKDLAKAVSMIQAELLAEKSAGTQENSIQNNK